MKPYGFIYETTNNINNKKYIGMHKLSNTVSDSTYLGSGTILNYAFSKYGKENFTRKIIAYTFSKKELGEKEKYYIQLFNATKNPEYYNIHSGGYGGCTILGFSTERKKQYRQRMSEVTKGEKNGMYGRNHSEKSKKLMSQHSQGKTLGELNGNYGNIGEKALNGKAVYKYKDPDFKILEKRYNTVRLALEDLELKGHTKLNRAMKEGTEYKGYYWSRTLKV